jgi:hypothetical protein
MSGLGLDKLCSKIWLLCPKAVLVKTMYYARETAYYARIMLEENSILIGTKTLKVVHFSFKMFGKQAKSDFLAALNIPFTSCLQIPHHL